MLRVYPYRSRRRFESAGRSGGVNEEQTWAVKTEAVGKSQWEESPYLIANEWISANIAQFLRLPVPPFAIVRKKRRDTAMFISYSYDGDTKPDDVEPAILYRRFPKECTGVVVFDILVANCDRHGGNLQVDKPSNPKTFYIIDHERSLFYVDEGKGIDRLRSRENRLGISDGRDSTDDYHCLIEHLDSVEHIEEWIGKVRSLPDWFIDDVCEEMHKDLSIKRRECDFVKEFLKRRREEIQKLISGNKSRFPSIGTWPLFL
jgi:Phosphatidylinositol 3- and 4-kinase